MSNPDTENVINSISEFTEYIEAHGKIAEGFRSEINSNKTNIETVSNIANSTAEGLAAVN